ncbi:MAG: PHP domain-containing protein [Lachnospiraceae bacterium]|nr:PHP domain-containing protein [Lachnospiraceae bacterium]
MKLDLHLHSTASDGQYRPAEVAWMAAEKGLEIFALTDHDTVAGLAEAGEAAEKLGIRFLPGIEISTQDVDEIHILGFGIDDRCEALLESCRAFAESRLKRAALICDWLNGQGIPVTMEEMQGYAGRAMPSRPHFAAYLMDHGYAASRSEAFERYLDTAEYHRAVNRVRPSCKKAIDLIHEAGGLAVLAHPAQYKMDDETLDGFIRRLKADGLDGVECFYSRNTPEQTALFLALAEKHGLRVSCGSDFHGELVKPDVRMGMEVEDRFRKALIWHR